MRIIKKVVNIILIIITLISFFIIFISMKKIIKKEDQVFFNHYISYVLSDSMKPEFKKGEIIIISKIESIEELEIGKIVTFNYVLKDSKGNIIKDKNDNNLTVKNTHRIIDIDLNKKQIRTKGDNNKSNQIETVDFEDVVGIYKRKSVFLSFFGLIFINKWISFVIIIGFIIFFIIKHLIKITKELNKINYENIKKELEEEKENKE